MRPGAVACVFALIALGAGLLALAAGGEFDRRYGTGSGSDPAPPEVTTSRAPGRYRSLYRTAFLPHRKNYGGLYSNAAEAQRNVASPQKLPLIYWTGGIETAGSLNQAGIEQIDRKSTRLNSSHLGI